MANRAEGSLETIRISDTLTFLDDRRRIALAEIDKAKFSRFHVKICFVAGVGFFTAAYDIFAIIIAVMMLGYVYGPDVDPTSDLRTLTSWQFTALKLAAPVGNLVGQLLFGWLADVFGRKRMYGIELMIMIVATFGQAVSGQGTALNIVYILIVWRFILGVGVGGDYPLSAVISSEFASTRTRGRLMTAVFACQGLGQLAASLVGLVVVAAFKDAIRHSTAEVDYTWRLLIGLGCVPAVIALYFRLTVPETPRFTMDVERNISRAVRDIQDASLSSTAETLHVDGVVGQTVVVAPRDPSDDFVAHFSRKKNLKVLFGTAYSWFALDVTFYTLSLDGVLILGFVYGGVPYDAYKSLLHLCVGSIVSSVAGYIPGFVATFLFIDIFGRKPIQLMGFVVLTILFWIMGFGYNRLSHRAFLGLYCLANFFQNFGPNTTTFIVPGEVFPTRHRSTAHGISAASGKLGAVVAQIVFATVGQQRLDVILEVLSFVMMTGVFSTLLIPETNQRTLEELSDEDQEAYVLGTVVRGPSVVEALR